MGLIIAFDPYFNISEGLEALTRYYEAKFDPADLPFLMHILKQGNLFNRTSMNGSLKSVYGRLKSLFNQAENLLKNDIDCDDKVLVKAYEYYRQDFKLNHFKVIIDMVTKKPEQMEQFNKLFNAAALQGQQLGINKFLEQIEELNKSEINIDYDMLLEDYQGRTDKTLAFGPFKQIIFGNTFAYSFVSSFTVGDITKLTDFILNIKNEVGRNTFLSNLSIVNKISSERYITISGYIRLMAILSIIEAAELTVDDFEMTPNLLRDIKDCDTKIIAEIVSVLKEIKYKNDKLEYLKEKLI